MANGSDRVKRAFQKLYAEIIGYEDGESELESIFEDRDPDKIFALDKGPDRQAQAAQLLVHMKEVLQELAIEKARKDRKEEEGSGRKGAGRRKGKSTKIDLVRRVNGVHDGFRYVVAEMSNGHWAAKITKTGRQVIPHPDAPLIVESPDLTKTFPDQSSAELAVRRVINRALTWYAERGITPLEKVRKTELGRAGIRRRTAGQVAERSRSDDERLEARAEKKRREKIEERRRARKVRSHEVDRRPRDIRSPGPGRKLVYIPKKNPSSPFSFFQSESDSLAQGKRAIKKQQEWFQKWKESLDTNNPDFRALIRSYDYAENARANFTIAEDHTLAESASKTLIDLRKTIINIFKSLMREMGRQKGLEDRKGSGPSYMRTADELWNSYILSRKITDLINAYKYLELAREEFVNSGDGDALDEARARIKLARKAILERCGG